MPLGPQSSESLPVNQPFSGPVPDRMYDLCPHQVLSMRRTGEATGVVAQLVCVTCGDVVESVTLRAWRRQGSASNGRNSAS